MTVDDQINALADMFKRGPRPTCEADGPASRPNGAYHTACEDVARAMTRNIAPTGRLTVDPALRRMLKLYLPAEQVDDVIASSP